MMIRLFFFSKTTDLSRFDVNVFRLHEAQRPQGNEPRVLPIMFHYLFFHSDPWFKSDNQLKFRINYAKCHKDRRTKTILNS